MLRLCLAFAIAAGLAVLPTRRAAAADGSGLTTVRLVSSTVNPPSVSNIYYLAAMEGSFARNGLQVKLQQSSGSPSSMAAIISGRAQFASVAVTTLANAAAEGVKAKMVVTGNFNFPGMIISQPSIKTIKDLIGKRLGATAIGSMDYTIMDSYLSSQGVKPSEISWVATRQTANTVQALAAGQIDAAWLPTPDVVKALALDPKLNILVSAGEIAKVAPNPGGAVVVTDEYVAQNAQTVQDFVNAVIEANRELYNNEAFFNQVVDKWMPGVYDQKQKQLLYDAHRPSWGVNGGLPLNVMRSALANWKAKVNPARAVNPYFSKVEDLIDFQFARTYLDRHGVVGGVLDTATWAHGQKE